MSPGRSRPQPAVGGRPATQIHPDERLTRGHGACTSLEFSVRSLSVGRLVCGPVAVTSPGVQPEARQPPACRQWRRRRSHPVHRRRRHAQAVVRQAAVPMAADEQDDDDRGGERGDRRQPQPHDADRRGRHRPHQRPRPRERRGDPAQPPAGSAVHPRHMPREALRRRSTPSRGWRRSPPGAAASRPGAGACRWPRCCRWAGA